MYSWVYRDLLSSAMRWEITVASWKQMRKQKSINTVFQHSFFTVCYFKRVLLIPHSIFSLPFARVQDKTIKIVQERLQGMSDSPELSPHAKHNGPMQVRHKTSGICLQILSFIRQWKNGGKPQKHTDCQYGYWKQLLQELLAFSQYKCDLLTLRFMSK